MLVFWVMGIAILQLQTKPASFVKNHPLWPDNLDNR
jgi:hypothetical protein